jgi:carboxypeptidase Q
LKKLVATSVLVLSASLAPAGERIDLEAANRIRHEGFHHSQVMETARYLTDHIGPRLTGSPALLAANEWTRATLEKWGLVAHLEGYHIDHGWSLERTSVHMLTPYAQPLSALPKAWTPGTDGPRRGRVVRADLSTDEDLERFRGQLAGAIVLLDEARTPEQIDADLFRRYDAAKLAEMEQFEVPDHDGPDWRARYRKMYEFWPKLAQFLVGEGVVAIIEVSDRDNMVVRVDRGGTQGLAELPAGVPALRMAAEHYNRLVRLLADGVEVELEVNVATTFYRDQKTAYNTIADLKGTDLADQIVLVGAHMDSWHAGTGATDDAGSCAAVLEAVRILQAAGLKPRRTIRVALWSGEELGFKGSQDYVKRYIATRPEPTDPDQLALPEGLRETTWPIQPLPGHASHSVYFNMDYGAGKIRGIFTQENAAAAAVFKEWLQPLHDLGVDTVSPESVGGTDHVPFDRVGVPAFQFIQDPRDYMGRTHHTNVDTYDHLSRDDLMQASVVLATFLWQAANRDEMMPRMPLPTKPPEDEESQAHKGGV